MFFISTYFLLNNLHLQTSINLITFDNKKHLAYPQHHYIKFVISKQAVTFN